jgi:hypothetical protein
MTRKVLLVTLCLCLAPLVLVAQEGAAEESEVSHEQHGEGEGHGEMEAHGEEHGGHHHKNEVALMLGGTYESEEEETLFTIGAEYARVLSPRVTTSFVAEYLDDADAWVFVAPFHLKPWKRSDWFIALGPGFEHKSRRGHGEEQGGEHGEVHTEELEMAESEESEDLFLWRTGIGYNFHVGEKMVIAPGLDLDLVREGGEWVEAIVFDVAIGFGF